MILSKTSSVITPIPTFSILMIIYKLKNTIQTVKIIQTPHQKMKIIIFSKTLVIITPIPVFSIYMRIIPTIKQSITQSTIPELQTQGTINSSL